MTNHPMPHGGSRWARFFVPSKTAPARIAELTVQRNPGAADDTTVFPIAAGPEIPLGVFLTATLPNILAEWPNWPGAKLAGAAPTPAQCDVLQRLGLFEHHMIVEPPRCFTTELSFTGSPGHGQSQIHDMFARLRFPPAANVPCAVAILTRRAQRFTLSNRASLAAWLRARRFTLAAPESEAFEATAASLARATLVLLADPRDAGLLGLCPPGTTVLEIAPEGWATSHARTRCDALGLNWQLFLATAPSYSLLNALPFGAVSPLAYEVSLEALGQTLGAL